MIRLLVATTLTLTGCGLLGGQPTPTPTTHADPFPANPSGEWDAVLVVDPERPASRPVSVEVALARAGGSALAVTGVLFVDTAYGETWLCAAILESHPPACGGPVLRVEGLGDAMTIGKAFRSVDNIRWLEGAALFGRVVR